MFPDVPVALRLRARTPPSSRLDRITVHAFGWIVYLIVLLSIAAGSHFARSAEVGRGAGIGPSQAVTSPVEPVEPVVKEPGVWASTLSPGRAETSRMVGFSWLSPDKTGVRFTNSLDVWASAGNRVLNNGSGVATGDFDRDGKVDVFFCSLNQGNRLYRNLGNWQFQDVTHEAGLNFPPLYYRAAVFADVNSDGWPDLLVGTASQGVRCYLNDQHGHFRDASDEAGTLSPFANETLTLADIDGDGTLDLYVCNNRTDDIRDRPRVPVVFVNRKPTVPPEMRHRISIENGVLQESGEPDILYLNDGYGHFRSVSWTNGAFFDVRGEVLTNTPLDWGLCASFRDFNGDGAPDLYVCNDYWTPDRLWINGGRGRFKEVDSLSLRKIPVSSMGADFADINRDGFIDIFAVDMLSRSSELRRRQTVAKKAAAPKPGDLESRIQSPHNALQLSRGDGTYAEIAWMAGVAASDWSWSPLFLDVDLDGYDDLLITAGHIRDIQDFDANDRIRAQQESWRTSPMAATNLGQAFLEARRDHARMYPPLNMPVVAFRNRGDLHFDEITTNWGLNVPGVNHGIATADFDNDGDLDLVVNRLGSGAAFFRNDVIAPRVAVHLRGRPPNTGAIGAKIELVGGAISNQIYEVSCGGSYMSSSDTLRVFAVGSTPSNLVLKVTWRDGSRSVIAGIRSNQRYEIDEATVAHLPPVVRSPTPTGPALFQDRSGWLGHTHHDDPFDDLARQPLLPRKFDQGGPGVAWADLDGDGWEDLIVGTGRGGALGIFHNQSGKAFTIDTNAWSRAGASRDQTTVLCLELESNQRVLLLGEASYEERGREESAVRRYALPSGASSSVGLPLGASVGPLAVADLDGDGDLDLFVGGQVVPGRYPAPASSRIYRHERGDWTLDMANTRALENVGVVNSATWSDLDGDGLPELILACEWGALRVYKNQAGILTDATASWGLAEMRGLWQSVAVGDFDGDGRMDLIAGNWGLNSAWQATAAKPLKLYYGDLAGAGQVEIIETEYDQTGRLAPSRLRDTVTASVPWLAERFPTHAAWSHATINDVLGDHRKAMKELNVTTLATTVFLNRGGKFEAVSLPAEAQFSPAFGLAVADFDGDGREDIVMGQNFFAFPLEDSRLDAGRSLLLRGNGDGRFTAVPGPISGLIVYGEQRGVAVADFDHDGRPDVVVTQNSAATRLFQNQAGRPGLRVRLHGDRGNPLAVGAKVRLKFADAFGPMHEVHAGGGYWSQDAATFVLAMPKTPTAIEVSWPAGPPLLRRIEANQIANGNLDITR